MNTLTEEQKAKQFEIFKEVAEENLRTFCNDFNSQLFNYRALNTHKICNVFDEDEVRQLAINFFTKTLAKKNFENQEFYFDKKVICKY